MNDIALKMGVSVVTVSKALANKEGPSEALRQKIKRCAEKMGYSYNALPHHMKNGKTGNIGIIMSRKFFGDTHDYYWKLYEIVMAKINSLNYFAILEIVAIEDEHKPVLPELLKKNKADGILVIGQFSHEYLKLILSSGIPVIFLDFYDDNDSAPAFIADNLYGSYTVTKYLIENGHRDILFVGSIHSTSSIMDRYLGYIRALMVNKIPIRKQSYIGDRDADGKYIKLKLPKNMPDAFVCNNDDVAVELVKTLKAAGFTVPNDISVVGFDNFSTRNHLNITTVEVNLESMAHAAVEAMIKKIKEPSYQACRHFASCKLIIKDTVKK